MIGWFSQEARRARGYRRYKQYEALLASAVPTLVATAILSAALFVAAEVNMVRLPTASVTTEAAVLGAYRTRREYLPNTQTLAVGFATQETSRAVALIEITSAERARLQNAGTVAIRHDPRRPEAASLATRPPLNAIAKRLRLYGWGLLAVTILGFVVTPFRAAWVRRKRDEYAGYGASDMQHA
jgi:hypothetical protein